MKRLLQVSLLLAAALASGCDDDGGKTPPGGDGGGGGGIAPPACDSNDDCDQGLVCREGPDGAVGCFACATDGDCGKAQECEQGTLTCVFREGWGDECALHEDCPLGFFCVQGLCQPGDLVVQCGALGQCPEGLRCNGGTRVCEEDIGCFQSEDCPQGEVCNPGTLRCEIRCTPETEQDICAAREHCNEDGRCVECTTAEDCGPGLACNVAAGRCTGSETCFTDRDCAAGLVCNRATSTCTPPPPPCASNEDCLEDERCDLRTGRCVRASCAPDQDEPNDTEEQAVTILPQDREGLSVCGTEEDWYRIALRRGDRINVNIEADVLVANGLDVQLRDDRGRVLDADPFLVDAVVASDANYFLRIRTNDEQARYALRIIVARGVPCDDDAREENDSYTAASSLSAGETRNLQACPADPDWYVVAAPAGQAVRARLVHDPLQGDLDLYLFDSDGTTLLRTSSTSQAEEVVEAPGVSGGRAYLQVIPSNDRTQNAYDLFVEVSGP